MPHALEMKPDPALRVAEKLALVMDRRYLDPLLGLALPWVGDLFSAGLGVYPVVLAARRGAPASLLTRMLLNLSVDLVGGSIPIIGDVWDFFFRAHSRNLALLRARSVDGRVARSSRDTLVVAAAGVVFLAALALPIVLLVAAVAALRRGL